MGQETHGQLDQPTDIVTWRVNPSLRILFSLRQKHARTKKSPIGNRGSRRSDGSKGGVLGVFNKLC